MLFYCTRFTITFLLYILSHFAKKINKAFLDLPICSVLSLPIFLAPSTSHKSTKETLKPTNERKNF